MPLEIWIKINKNNPDMINVILTSSAIPYSKNEITTKKSYPFTDNNTQKWRPSKKWSPFVNFTHVFCGVFVVLWWCLHP